jgi:hypothetical protein
VIIDNLRFNYQIIDDHFFNYKNIGTGQTHLKLTIKKLITI